MFLPINKEDLKLRNIEKLDFIMITGEAYTDHPSFGHAIISRYIESKGYTIGIIPQPQKDEDYRVLGEPNYAFIVSAGVIDSMVNNYSVSKKKRKVDVYSAGGKYGLRPDRATDVYTNNIKRIFENPFVITGSIEVSLRKFAHYDYWKDEVIPSIAVSSKADLLIYGMGERPFEEILKRLDKGIPISKIKDVRGTYYLETDEDKVSKIINRKDTVIIPSFEDVVNDKKLYIKAHMDTLKEQDDVYGKTIIQKSGKKYVIQNPPAKPLNTEEMDYVYNLPYERTYHPMYIKDGGVPAITEVEFSLVSNRGCFGSCNYCAITYHQGRKISVRSHDNIIDEDKKLINSKNFKGYIHDVGGPTADFRSMACKKQEKYGVCKERQCMFPTLCKNLTIDHTDYLNLLRKLRSLDKVKKVFVRSGLRFDYVLADEDETFLKELCQHHISGQLKVAPEHTVPKVLKKMGKPSFDVYKKFKVKYDEMNKKLNKEQYLVPYLISSHPGSTLKDAIKVAEYLNEVHHMPEQVQDFYPTPATISTCMYYTEMDPYTFEKIYVPKTDYDKKLQRILLQYRKKENYELVKESLIKAGRLDLIGFTPNCLIKPKKEEVYKIRAMQKDRENSNKSKFTKKKKMIRNLHKKRQILI